MGTVCSRGCWVVCSVAGDIGVSGCFAGPVLVIGMILSPLLGGGRFGAVIVRTPSEDRVLVRSATS